MDACGALQRMIKRFCTSCTIRSMRTIEELEEWWPSFESQNLGPDFPGSTRATSDTTRITEKGRSAFWRSFLLLQDVDISRWPEKLDKTRQAFDELRKKFLDPLQQPEESDALLDPLSDSPNYKSPWSDLRKDEVIREEIKQDVERCLPDNQYFRDPAVQIMSLDILFIWAKLNPDIGYRQGMHELLAPVIWVIDQDSVDSGSISIIAGTKTTTQLILKIFDNRYVSHDAFAIFTRIMQQAKSSYELHDPLTSGSRERAVGSASSQDAAITQRSQIIFSELLPQVDPELSAHLTNIGIIPQIFLIRWIRLLFAREFTFELLLQLWDKIFAEGITSLCIDLVCVVMLLRIKQQLLDSDNSQALQLLLHYPTLPTDSGPPTLVDEAQVLKSNLNQLTGSLPDPASLKNEFLPTDGFVTPKRSKELSRSSSKSKPLSNIETILNDTARSISNRGERWGVYQTVRDVAGEVRKNVATLQSKTHSRISSRDFLGVRDQHSSESNVAHRLNELDARSKSLAKMLEGAVADLWQQQKEASNEKAFDDKQMEVFTTAIAKVQFVQIYLEDTSLALPSEEQDSEQPESRGSTTPNPAILSPKLAAQRTSSATTAPVSPAQDEKEKTKAVHNTPPVERPPVKSSEEPPQSSKLGRPPLEQSSFSWMLGQEPSAKSSRASFLSSSPFQESRTGAKRLSRGHSAYLFGEEDKSSDTYEGQDQLFGSPSRSGTRRPRDTNSSLRRFGDQ